MKLIQLRRIDLALGKPAPWPVYDKNNNMVLRAGEAIDNHSHLENLFKQGLFRAPKSAQPINQAAPRVTEARPQDGGEPETQYDLEEMQLPVGNRVQLQSTQDQSSPRYSGRYLGHIKGISVMVSTPTEDEKILFIREGQTFIVRAFTGKTAFGFTSAVIRACNAPYPYLHLAYPKQLQGVEIRRSKRMAVRIIGSLQSQTIENAQPQSCLIVNLSPTGALLTAAAQLGKMDEKIQLSFRIKSGPVDDYVEALGTIRSISLSEDTKDGVQFNHGIQFHDLQQRDILLLHSLAYQKFVEGGAEL